MDSQHLVAGLILEKVAMLMAQAAGYQGDSVWTYRVQVTVGRHDAHPAGKGEVDSFVNEFTGGRLPRWYMVPKGAADETASVATERGKIMHLLLRERRLWEPVANTFV